MVKNTSYTDVWDIGRCALCFLSLLGIFGNKKSWKIFQGHISQVSPLAAFSHHLKGFSSVSVARSFFKTIFLFPSLPGFGPAEAHEQFVFRYRCPWRCHRWRRVTRTCHSGDPRGLRSAGPQRLLFSLVNQCFAFGNYIFVALWCRVAILISQLCGVYGNLRARCKWTSLTCLIIL